MGRYRLEAGSDRDVFSRAATCLLHGEGGETPGETAAGTDMLHVGIIESPHCFFYGPCYVMMRAVNKADGPNVFNESALSSG